MAIYYVDPTYGDDANDGLSWNSPWLTCYAHPTQLTDFDEVRYAKSPDPKSLGEATFTSNNALVTLATARTTTIENGIGNTWTSGGTGITLSSTSIRKIGASSQYIYVGSAFPGGKLAYKTLASELDLSAYSKISLWLYTNNVTYFESKNIELCLCSDSLGEVPVHSFAFEGMVASTMQNFLFDIPDNLSSSVKSVALYCTQNTYAVYIAIQNIIATNDLYPGCVIADHSNITGHYFGIAAVDETDVYLEFATKGFIGESGTKTAYMCECNRFLVPAGSTTSGAIMTPAQGLSVIGGWNKATGERDGRTWFYGTNLKGNGFYPKHLETTLKGFGFSLFYQAIISTSSLRSIFVEDVCVACSGTYGIRVYGESLLKNIFISGTPKGVYIDYSPVFIDGGSIVGTSSYAIENFSGYGSDFKNISFANTGGIKDSTSNNLFENLSFDPYHSNYIIFASTGGGHTFRNITSANSTANIYAHASTFIDIADSAINVSSTGHFFTSDSSYRKYRKVNTSTILWNTDNKPEGAYGSWSLRFGQAPILMRNGYIPEYNYFNIAEVAVTAGATVTAKILYNSYSGTTHRFIVRSKKSPVAEDVYLDAGYTVGLWVEIQLQFTAIRNGVATIEVTRTDELGISQTLNIAKISFV